MSKQKNEEANKMKNARRALRIAHRRVAARPLRAAALPPQRRSTVRLCGVLLRDHQFVVPHDPHLRAEPETGGVGRGRVQRRRACDKRGPEVDAVDAGERAVGVDVL